MFSPDCAINESGNLEDSEFEGEENASKVKKEQAPKKTNSVETIQ